MKKILISLVCISVIPVFCCAQTEKEDITTSQLIFGKARKTIINECIRISENEKAAFWKMYDQYEEKNNAINQERVGILKKYADNYTNIDEALAKKLALDFLVNTAKCNELYSEYFKKFKKKFGGVKAAAVIQAEIYINELTIYQRNHAIQ